MNLTSQPLRPLLLSEKTQRKDLKPVSSLTVFFLLFALSVSAFVLRVMVASSAGWLDAALSLPGSVTCGLAWLLSRALFRPSGKVGNWPIIVVCGLFVSGVLLMGADALAISGTPALRMVDNLHSLASSTVLLMTLFEAVDGLGKGAAKYERRFRFIFLAGYAALLGISVVWFRGVADATGGVEVAKAVCAALALAGACAAVVYRQRSSAPLRRREQAGEADLAARLRTLLDSEEIYRDADIKVRDVARYLNEPEYKVSQCITGPLGYANFNRLINAHRIKAAVDMLVDPVLSERSILSVAMDCGFGSIGPFNRAFKERTGVTPRQYRARGAAD